MSVNLEFAAEEDNIFDCYTIQEFHEELLSMLMVDCLSHGDKICESMKLTVHGDGIFALGMEEHLLLCAFPYDEKVVEEALEEVYVTFLEIGKSPHRFNRVIINDDKVMVDLCSVH